VSINMTQAPRTQQILPGAPTTVWSYSASLVSGAPDTLTPVPNSFLGPIIQVWQGQHISINWTNLLAEPSVTHWHGMDVPSDMDGHPSMPTASGDSRTITFPILNRAGTYWYHPHPDMATVEQVQMGLAGYFIVHDAEEAALNLPTGAYDLPICIQDRTFDGNNQFYYNPTMVAGFFGSTVLVNGWPNYTHPTASRVHRLRLLNGSTSRIYKLAFSDGTPMVVIGNDGGLLAAPETKPYLILSPGERAEVWADFRGKALGSQITLQSLAFTSNGGQGAPLNIMQFSITQAVTEDRTLPATLSSIMPYQLADAVNGSTPKVYDINATPGGGMPNFTINGGLFSMTEVAPNEIARCNSLEVIKVNNTLGAMQIPHPIHFHGRQFQIIGRTVTAAGQANWNTVKDGFNDSGWKDTFLIMPGETVTLLVRHSSYPGMYVYHCHNLVHEDMGMMRNFRLDADVPACPADLDDGSGMGMPDEAVTIDDLLYFLMAFEAGTPAADLDDGSGMGMPDAAVTIDDLLFFLVHFEAGC
jgi:FtsP/CotA-like multicopper oxidase with cupredoxin domain